VRVEGRVEDLLEGDALEDGHKTGFCQFFFVGVGEAGNGWVTYRLARKTARLRATPRYTNTRNGCPGLRRR
jgi:hypothetical protein